MCRRAADSPSLPPSFAPPTRASLALPGDGCMQSLPLPLASFREVFTVNTRTHPLKGERRLTPSNFALDRQLQIVQMYCGGVELDQLAFLPYFEEICGKPIMWTSGGVEFQFGGTSRRTQAGLGRLVNSYPVQYLHVSLDLRVICTT